MGNITSPLLSSYSNSSSQLLEDPTKICRDTLVFSIYSLHTETQYQNGGPSKTSLGIWFSTEWLEWNGMKRQALAVFLFGVLALMVGADSASMIDCCCNGMNE